MVWRVAAILSGLWAKSSITVISLAAPTTSNRRRIPLNSSRCFAASARPTPHAIVALSAASALAKLCRPGTFSVTSTTWPLARAFTGNAIPPGEQIGCCIAQAPGQNLARLQIGHERRGLRIVEVEHHRLPLADEAAEEGAQLVERLVIEGDVVYDRDAGRKQRDRTVALVDFANRS